MRAEVRDTPFEPYAELKAYQAHHADPGAIGAAAFFIGSMRHTHQAHTVQRMWLEHYPAMTEATLNQLLADARARWPLFDALIIHRVGAVYPSDPIVLVACWSAHRRAALEACDWLLERLKFEAPFWKKETTLSGEHWVENNTDGH